MNNLITDYCKTYNDTKNCIRLLYRLIFEINKELQNKWVDTKQGSTIDPTFILSQFERNENEKVKTIYSSILQIISKDSNFLNNGEQSFIKSPIRFMNVAWKLFGDLISIIDIYNEARKTILEKYNIKFEAKTITQFISLSDLFNECMPLNKTLKKNDLDNLKLEESNEVNDDYRRCFFEILILEQLIDFLPKPPFNYQRKRHILSSYIVNRVFGILFNIPGLNFLFEDGLLTPIMDQGASMLILGTPGSGKTTLALQIAKDVASQGGLAIYFTTEQTIESLNMMITSFIWENEFKFIVTSDNDNALCKIKTLEGRGLLLVLGLTKSNRGDSINSIKTIFEGVNKVDWPLRVIVVDSLTALRLDDEDNNGINEAAFYSTRDNIEQMFELPKIHNFLGIFVGEASHRTKDAEIAKYLCDIMISLSIPEGSDEYSNRQISILKCRGQHIQRGFHHFSIEREEGIIIYPSCSAILSRQGGGKIFNDNRMIEFQLKGIESLLGTDKITKNKSLAIVGEPDTGKSFILRQLFFSPYHDMEKMNEETFLIVSFRDEGDRMLEIIDSFEPIKNLYTKIANGPQKVFLETLTFKMGYISPGMLISKIMKKLSERKELNRPVSRVLLDDLTLLFQGFPLINKQPMFLATILDIFKTEGINVLLSYSTYENMEAKLRIQLSSLCDYLICTKSFRENPTSPRRIFLSVIKSIEKKHSNFEHEFIMKHNFIKLEMY